MTWEVIISIITALGGWETIKYFIERRQRKRISEAQADSDEFHVLRETIEFLQQQLHDKELRFSEQTDILRKANTELLELQKSKAQTELELQKYRCVVPKCLKREPQNGY